jgi:hypothetical protein
MAEGILERTERRVEKAILQLAAYYAVFGMPLSEAEANSYLGIKTGHLAIREALRQLCDDGKLELDDDGFYRLSGQTYHHRELTNRRQAALLARARRWGKFFALLPFVKCVVVVNSSGIGNVRADSDIDLLIVTKPNRIYITKGILMYGLKLLGQLENSKNKAGRFSLGMFLTTAGLNWQRDVMAVNDPHLAYWLMLAKPVYGANIWFELLKSSPYVAETFPNYVWPKSNIRVYSGGLSYLDKLDNKGYRQHLKHTAGQPKMHTKEAFVRVRPDVLNLHALDQSSKIARRFKRIIKTV